MCSLNIVHSSSVQIPFRTHCTRNAWSNTSENLERRRSTNLLNFNSSRVTSATRPIENPEFSGFNLETGTFNALYSFFSKYLTSSNSPRFCPPGSVVISVPLPPSLRGNQKSSIIDMNLRSSRTSPVLASYTNLFLYLTIMSRRYCSAFSFGKLPTSM